MSNSLLPASNSSNDNEKQYNIGLSQLLIAAEGDLALVVERYNYNKPTDDHIGQVDVLEAFLKTASSTSEVQDAIKAQMLLNFLQILQVTKDQLISALPDFDGPALLRTFKEVVTAIAAVLPQPAPTIQNNTNVNVLQQYDPSPARDKMLERLEAIKEMEQRYPINKSANAIIEGNLAEDNEEASD